MTSKDALFKLASFCLYDDVIDATLGIIVKDLEVLEILKKHLYIVEPDNEEDLKEFNKVDYLRLFDCMTRKEYQVIKEWLEDA